MTKNEKIPLIALGAGPYTATLLDTFDDFAEELPYRLAGFAQNEDPSRRGEKVEDKPVYTLEELEPLASTHEALCILGDPRAKRRFVEQVGALGFRFATLIHPLGRHSRRCTMGEGGYVGIHAMTFRNARIGRHVSVLGQAIVGDECIVEDFAFIATDSKLSGGVRIGEGAFVGVGSIIKERLTIGKGAVIGAGSVVIRDVPDGATVVGNPAREIAPRGKIFKSVE